MIEINIILCELLEMIINWCELNKINENWYVIDKKLWWWCFVYDYKKRKSKGWDHVCGEV